MSKRSRSTEYTYARKGLFLSPTSTPRSRSSQPLSIGTGHYKGRLPAPKRAPRAGKYALYGHRAECERYIANRASNDVVYVGAQVAPAGSIGQSVGVAFLRMIMKRHYQIEYSTTEQQLRPLASGTGAGSSVTDADFDYFPAGIKFWRKTTSATLFGGTYAPQYDVAVTYLFPAPGVTSTVASFGQWFNENVFNSVAFGSVSTAGSSNDRVELHAYQFVMAEVAGSAVRYSNQAVMPLEGQYLSAYSVVRIHVQNVTPADALEAGNVYQTTRIDANPLKGVLMRFRDPTPMVKDAANGAGIDGSGVNNYGWALQNDINGDGLIMPGSNPPTGPWAQLPTADMFKNCVGMAHITLEPGDIKDYSLNFKFSGTVQALMKGFQTSFTDASGNSFPLPSSNNKQFGNSFLFALEKRMPTGPAAVAVNIHYENYYGAVFGGRRKTPMVREARSLGATAADGNV